MSTATAKPPLDLKGFSAAVYLEIDRIKTEPASEVRAAIDDEAIKAYAENLDDLPPLLVIVDENDVHWLADGGHRLNAFKAKGCDKVRCRIKSGTYLEAFHLACHANDVHGVRTTNEDKKRRTEIAVRKFGDKSTRIVADICGVSHELVRQFRLEVSTVDTSRHTGKDGKSYPAKKAESGASSLAIGAGSGLAPRWRWSGT